MAKNKIQFQKGLSLTEFLSQYGTEEQCRETLFRMRWPQGFQCPKCGHPGYCEIRNRKVYQCYKCHAQTSLIQGTIFAGTKLPMRLWLMGIYLVTQAKDGYLFAQSGQDRRNLRQCRLANETQATAGHEKPR
jgi:ribosomal protein L37AE/L43A